MQSHEAKPLLAGFIDGYKGHRGGIVEIDEFGNKLMRESLDQIEEAKPQIFLANLSEMMADQVLIVRPYRPDEYLPTIPEDKMPLPLRRVRSNSSRQPPLLAIAQAISES
jgi:hypothetical protein